MRAVTVGIDRRVPIGVAIIVAIVSGLGIHVGASAGGRRASRTWVGAWASSPSPPPGTVPSTFENVTLRQIVHPSIGGDGVRVRFSNVFGSVPLRIDAAGIGIHAGDGRVVAGTDRSLTFAGAPAVSIPPGARYFSDPVDLSIEAGQDLAISLYVAERMEGSTMHLTAGQTSFLSSLGNFVGAEAMPDGSTKLHSWFWLTGVDVLVHRGARVVVAAGDSITDGWRSTADANARWPDVLARRLDVRHAGRRKVAVLNAGISGNRILTSTPGFGPNLLARLDRDVLTQSGVTHVILLEGINDIGVPEIQGSAEPPVTAAAIVAGMRQIIDRAHARGLTVYGGTILPYGGAAYYSEAGEAKRLEINAFIRDGGAFDAVIDFDEAVRDPAEPSRLLSEYDSGDHLHPSDAGYARMGEVVDLKLFGSKGRSPSQFSRPRAAVSLDVAPAAPVLPWRGPARCWGFSGCPLQWGGEGL